MKRCADCGGLFDGEHWQKLCWSCWREKKDAANDAAYEEGYADGHRAGLRQGARAANSKPAPGPLDRDLLTLLVELAHPDRHPPERAEKANRATAALLELRSGAAA